MNTNIVIFLKLLLLAVFSNQANAQQVTALHSSSGAIMFYGTQSFVEAYSQAADGDTLYLSGGSFVPPSGVDKELVIYGAGYHPNYTTATFPTQISSTLFIGQNANNLFMEGLLFSSSVESVNSAGLTGVNLSRCRIAGNLSIVGSSGANSNFAFTECIINGSTNLFALTNSSFYNCFFVGNVSNASGVLFSNSIFFYNSLASQTTAKVFYNIQGCTVNNCIFTANSNSHVTTSISVGNVFENNLFASSSPFFGSAPIFANNYFGFDMNEVFVNYTGDSFSYEAEYQLQQPDVLLGNDGTQVGVYGGLFPLKEGGIPMNPHISNKNISGTTNASGQLEVEITVEAQEQ